VINRSKPLCAAMVSAALAALGTTAWADDSSQQDVSSEIQSLKARIEQLEAKQKQQQEETAKKDQAQKQRDEQASFGQVLSDADHRSRLFDETGITAGYKDNRFFIGSDDGNFVLRPWYHIQIRNVTLSRQDQKPGGRDDIQNGFEIRRMKIGLDGNMFTPDFTYFFNWATSRTTGTPILEEAWVKYRFTDTPFYIKAGQIKDPLLHDQIVSSRYQQSAERSLTADIFANGDAFTEGATFIYDPKTFVRAEAGVNHGLRSANTNFQDFPANPFDFGVAGRAEVKLFGRWQDYGQIGAVDVKEPLLVIGVGADSSQRGHATQTVGAVDVQYADQNGLNLYGAAVDRYTNHNFGIATVSAAGASFITNPDPAVLGRATNEYSLLAEAGYQFANHLEPFGRYEYIRLQGTPAGSRNYFHVITAGVNYYWYGHRAKLTAEVIYLPNGLPIDDSGGDVLASGPGKGELSGVVQFQLLL
jgi:hypothetical protein